MDFKIRAVTLLKAHWCLSLLISFHDDALIDLPQDLEISRQSIKEELEHMLTKVSEEDRQFILSKVYSHRWSEAFQHLRKMSLK